MCSINRYAFSKISGISLGSRVIRIIAFWGSILRITYEGSNWSGNLAKPHEIQLHLEIPASFSFCKFSI